jgi:hypothetical protein
MPVAGSTHDFRFTAKKFSSGEAAPYPALASHASRASPEGRRRSRSVIES